ncbi:hypothetical protein EWM64_g4039 [Hericium alpestre]|uniref:RTA1-domain-containing protein n=1 Tax=Hericium alpestre TaxID=135208 RepID=A0A4Y9ZYR8_9AGAM|nr:hypothetical protein EWM64_g4039 [Hericium alpestre]
MTSGGRQHAPCLIDFKRALGCLLLAARPALAARGDNPPHVADPFADPKDDPYNPLGYIASNTLTTIAFDLVLVTAIAHAVSMWKWRAWWLTCLIVGELTFAFGLGCRYALHNTPDSRGWYILEYLFVILSPCAFIAADYIILGRLVRHLGCERHLRIVPPHRITLFFILSDIVTFLIQAAGGGISSGTSATSGKIGTKIFLVGLILQLVSFFTFTSIFVIFLLRIRKHEPAIWTRDRDAGKTLFWDWRALAIALAISCVGILIRSVFRIAEMSQGFGGAIARNEGLFYGFDTLPLFIAVVVWAVVWPGRFIRAPPKPKAVDEEVTAGQPMELVGGPIQASLDSYEAQGSGAIMVHHR